MQFPTLSAELLKERLRIPSGKLRLVIDSDTKNEVDDQFAISWAIRCKDRFAVEAVYAAPFSQDCFQAISCNNQDRTAITELNGHSQNPKDGMEQSYEEIKKVFGLLGEDSQGRVFRGSNRYLGNSGEPVSSEAATDLIRRAMSGDEPLYVAAIGAITNIASAILLEPRIIEKIVVIWLGGQPLHFGHGIEFNLMQDIAASQIIFDCGVPLVFIPCMGVASLLSTSAAELKEQLLGKSNIGTYLSEICLDAFQNPQAAVSMVNMDRFGYLLDQEDQSEAYLADFKSEHIAWSRIIWDVSVIAFLKNPNWVTSRLAPSPVLKNDLHWDTLQGGRHPIRIATYCHRDLIFGDLFECLNVDS